MVKPGAAAESQRIAYTGRQGGNRVVFLKQQIMTIQLENQRDLAGELGSARFDETGGRSVGVAASLDG
jgi:hypothetical protein